MPTRWQHIVLAIHTALCGRTAAELNLLEPPPAVKVLQPVAGFPLRK